MRAGWIALGMVFAGTVHAQAPWSPADLDTIASMRLSQVPAAPADASNRHERDPRAIALGKELFFDERFSKPGNVSCATCHQPAFQFQDGKPRGRAIGETPRRTQPLAHVAHNAWFFWDGRKDSLWAQALAPLEDAREHGGTRALYAHLVAEHYRAEYEAVFGPLPDLSNVPRDAGPKGTTAERVAWRALDKTVQLAVSRVFANLGKAIAAYERTLVHTPSRFDRYAEALVRGKPRLDESERLTREEETGLALFIGRGRCNTCHTGPLMTDHYFHSTRVPPREPGRPDLGRYLGADEALADEFNCLGAFSDAQPAQCRELRFIVHGDPLLKRAFKTPGLRGVATRAPYMHAGQLASLARVIAHYAEAPESLPAERRIVQGHVMGSELLPLKLSDKEAAALVAFLATLDSTTIERATAVAKPE
ncbi:MAG: cytochrome-c peroxidase [Betaproteobacteria bacterium]|nr:cytochrome-c peroxidase [Betaproteobacteria bacterium]